MGSYYDDATEILTENGWKLFEDVIYKEKLATVDPSTTNIIYEEPKRLTKMSYNGEMIVGKSRFMDFKVTPGHRLLILTGSTDIFSNKNFKNYKFIKAEDLPPCCKMMKYKYPRGCKHGACSYYGDYKVNRSLHLFKENYSGYVYCADVPTYHTLITRRSTQGSIPSLILISGM